MKKDTAARAQGLQKKKKAKARQWALVVRLLLCRSCVARMLNLGATAGVENVRDKCGCQAFLPRLFSGNEKERKPSVYIPFLYTVVA
jgi:hypothetical protein